MPDMDWLSQLVSPQTQNMSAMPSAPQDSYTPTSGSQMEADSRSSIDSILARLQASQEANHQNDRNMQWMSFFSKLASSKNPTFGGGLGDASDALSGTMGEQQKSNKILNQQALQDELKAREFQQQQALQQQQVNQTGAYQTGELELGRQKIAKEMQMMGWDTQKLPNGKLVNVNKITGEVKPITLPDSMMGASGQNPYGYDVGTIPQGTTAPVLDPKFDPTANMPPVQKAIADRKMQEQLEKDNKEAAVNNDSIERLKAAKQVITTAPVGGITNLLGVGAVADAFSTQRQELNALNKELALAPGERPQNMRITQGEVYMLKQAQPGADKTPEANAAIADANIAIRTRPSEFANFKNDFVANNGYWNDAVGQQMFNKYIKDNPIIDVSKSEKGHLVLNPNRQTIEQYANNGGFAKWGVKGGSGGKQTEASPSAAPKTMHFNDLPD